MKKIYFFILLLLAFEVSAYTQQYKKIWTGIDSVKESTGINDVVTDKNGNTYLTGYHIFNGANYYEKHFLLYKVNASGVVEWTRYFNDMQDSLDEGIAVAVDEPGNVYVALKRIDTFCNSCTNPSKVSDIVTMKYDAAGNRKWLNRYHDTILNLASPTDITINADGSVAVTGNLRVYNKVTFDYADKMLVIKIHPTGETAWTRKMKQVIANTVCFDNKDNIIVGGASSPDNYFTTQKPMVLKYSSSGDLLWSNIYDEYRKNGTIYFIGCDSLNNIYANGRTDTIAFYNHSRIITLKYSADGVRKWFRKEQDNSYTYSYEGGFKIDNAGNSYLTGFVNKSDYDDEWLIASYDKHGTRKWLITFDNIQLLDEPNALAIDGAGHTFVTGHLDNVYGDYFIATLAIDNNSGAILDTLIYKANPKSNAFPFGVGVDKNNDVYVSGGIGFPGKKPAYLFTVKYAIKTNLFVDKSLPVSRLSDIKLYPNPVRDQLSVNFKSVKDKRYQCFIYDANGNLLETALMNEAEGAYFTQIHVGNLHQGLYTLKITDGTELVSKIFLKE